MNYSQLLTAISDWTHRADLATPAPTFVELAEARLSRTLRLSQFAASTTLTITTGSSSVALPTDFLEGRSVTGSDGDWRQVGPAELQRMTQLGDESRAFTVYGGSLHIPFEVGEDTDLTLHYWTRITALSESAPTNWLLTNHPDVYVFTALALAAVYARNPGAAQAYEAQAGAAIEALRSADVSSNWFSAEIPAGYGL